ncbi:MAG: TonB-dependent receptor [Acidobacteriota bacterium]|nr:TonB-dependent receptor [Acidobacteriota bacterium]
MSLKRSSISCVALCLTLTGALHAQGDGGIDGRVVRDDGAGLGGVVVVITETGDVELTGGGGSYAFRGVAAGDYTLSLTLGDNTTTESVTVGAGEVTTVETQVDWDVSFAETITVYSASRRRERVVDAPAAVTVMNQTDIARESSAGQLPKVLEFTPGVEVTQSGVHDFNLNTRGFNSSLTRRVQVLVDGRDPAVPFLGSTEWGYLANQEGLASIELVRGPSSALYGKNAFNGVLNLITEAPKDSVGGRLTLSGGELGTLRGELGWSADLGADWYMKLKAAYFEGDGFTVPRTSTTEYAGLPLERGTATDFHDSSDFSIRFDKELGNTGILTLETGYFDAEGYVVVTGIGRVDVNDIERTYSRVNFSTDHFNVLAYTNDRESPDQLALASGGRIFLDASNEVVEAQTNWDFNQGRTRLVLGASTKSEDIDTANFQGFQTLTFAPVSSDSDAVFGQVDFEIGDKVKLVLAGRYDSSSLHESQTSPKAALVYGINPDHKLRFSYNEAFQVANYSEFFLDAPTVIPGTTLAAIDLSGIEAALCTPFGVVCGFGSPTRVRALGNKDLDLEEVTSFEVGYSGIIGGKAFLTIDYYNNELENFITDLSANPFGLVNPNFGPYQIPAGHPLPGTLAATLEGALGPLIAFLSNNVDGTPIFALASYTNAGAVDTEGIDFGVTVQANRNWGWDLSYSWFDFEIIEAGVSANDLEPNAPEGKFAAGINYRGEKAGGSLSVRGVDGFNWAAGAFQGRVPSYEVVNLSADYLANDQVTVGLNISNLLDDDHYESFGGDLVGRRGIGYVRFNW